MFIRLERRGEGSLRRCLDDISMRSRDGVQKEERNHLDLQDGVEVVVSQASMWQISGNCMRGSLRSFKFVIAMLNGIMHE